MFKLYKNLKPADWFGVILIIGLTILQVYCTMTLVDYMQNIIKSITFIQYQNNPGDIQGLQFMLSAVGNDWSKLTDVNFIVNTFHLPIEAANLIVSIALASTNDIWFNGGMMLAFAVGTAAAQVLISVVASYVAADLSTNVRTEVYKKVEGFSLAEINNFKTSSLITRTTNDIQQVQMANLMMMRMIFAAPVTAIWAIIKIQASSFELTIATAVAIVLLITIIATMMLLVLPKFKIMQKLTDKINNVARENLTGIRIVRAYNAEQYQEDKFEVANERMTKTQIFAGKVMAIMQPSMMIIMNGIGLAIYWIGASLINNGALDYSTVTAFMMLSSQIIMSFVMLMMMFILWPRASVSAQRINEVLATKSSIEDPINSLTSEEKGTIQFKNVSFKFPDGDDYAVSNIDFTVNKGETVAFIGATGSGKTTIINLIPRLFDTTKGEILIDGINVKNYKQKDLRSKIGYVPQKGVLFSGSIKENIAFGVENITENSIKEAAKVAEAEEFIDTLDGGYNYLISQGGKNVSGGQKQRLCIARAVAFNPEIFIFDDSFSALDYKTDKKVRGNLKEFAKDTTKVIVAQRIGTIIDADQIIVLDDGKIVGKGTHKQLLKNCDVYREIALSQLSREELGL